jgi:hypothetical protein
MKFRRCFNLAAQVWRGVEQYPANAIQTDGNLQLKSWCRTYPSGAYPRAITASAIPLGKSSASRRAEQFDDHRELCRLKFRSRVAVDFAAKADFFKIGPNPFHRFTSFLGAGLNRLPGFLFEAGKRL